MLRPGSARTVYSGARRPEIAVDTSRRMVQRGVSCIHGHRDLTTVDWEEKYAHKRKTFDEAIALIPRGKHVFVGSGAAEPIGLVEALVRNAQRFAENPIVHLLTLGPAPYVEAKYAAHFRHNAFFIGPNVREAVRDGRADYTPVFLSQIPALIRSRRMPIDVALIAVTPPDAFGFVNLGVSVDVVLAAIDAARVVIAEINPRMPVVYGSGFMPMDRVDAWILNETALPELKAEPLDDVAQEVGRNVASLVEDGSTIQVGIGQIPDATLKALSTKQDLGVWTEMFSDGVVELIRNGNVTGKYKTIHPRKVSSSFTFGSKATYDFVDRNPLFTFHPSDYINNPMRIAEQHKMVAVNSALQIDLTGQVCADSIGTRFYSGIGGQVDFIRGASMCPGGKPIIALRSTAAGGTISRIVATLDVGAGVVTSRGDVRFVVTEHGIADLQGKSIRERAMSLISIAHPDFRSDLLSAAKQRRYVFSDQIEPRAGYPRQYEKAWITKTGRPVALRPIRVTDEQKLTDFFYNLSDQTIYKRWMHVLRSMPHKNILQYLDVDYRQTMAIIAEHSPEGQEPELIGVGRYHGDRATNRAEVAFVVRDDWQGQGLGGELLRHLIQIARDNGIDALTAEVLADNLVMMHVFHRCGLDLKSTFEGGVYSLTIPLPREHTDATQ